MTVQKKVTPILIEPTKTFENFDCMDRKAFAERLTQVISTFYPFADGAYVLSLNASFGAGKTTFLQMWQSFLQSESQGYTVIYLNAWEHDFGDEPLVPIVHTLIEKIGTSKPQEKVIKALHGALGAVALASNSVLAHASGINVHEILKAVESEIGENDLQKLGEDLNTSFTMKEKIYSNLKDCLKQYLETLQNKPLVILVDELDRVRPDYSVKFLEAIKHIFPIQGICFVLAVDRNQLEASVKQLYGAIDFDNYFRRFITREADLAEPQEASWQRFIQKLSKEYFDDKMSAGVTFAFDSSQKTAVLDFAATICRAFRLRPRQAEHLFRVYSQFMAADKSQKYYEIALRVPLFLIAVLICGERDLYHRLGKGLVGPAELSNFIDTLSLSNQDETSKTQILCDMLSYTLTANNGPAQEEAVLLIQKKLPHLGTRPQNEILDMLAKAGDRWGQLPTSISKLQRFYIKLEMWLPFIN